MHERLKRIIFKKLDKDLGHAEIIVDDDKSIWFIDRANKYWYLELRNGGTLWWRYSFFRRFFPLFGMEREEYEPVIAEWVEEVLKRGVSSTLGLNESYMIKVEEVLKRGVSSTHYFNLSLYHKVEEALERGVSSTIGLGSKADKKVEKVLKHGLSSTNSKELLPFEVEKVLSLKAGVRECKMKIKKIFKKFTSK